VGNKYGAITEAAMNGEIDFKESLEAHGFARRFKRRGMQTVAENLP
jgi:phosphoserine phosphatase